MGDEIIIHPDDGVIKDFAYRGRKNLDAAWIADGVTEIGRAAFEDCKSLARVSLNSSVHRKIALNAFDGCPWQP